MIVWNISDNVKNGSAGTFVGVKGDKLEIEIPSHGNVLLKRQTWSKQSRSGNNVGIRTQHPVVLFYACTCHKTQGLTLPHAVVHCSKEFVPGLIYVAISQVRHPDDLQVCRFKCDQLLQPPDEALHVCENSQAECSDLSCCVNGELTSDFFKVSNLGAEFGEGDGDTPETLPVDSYPDGLVLLILKGRMTICL